MKCILAVTSAKVSDFVTIYFKVGGVQELSEGRHVIAEKVERADELVGLGCSEHSFVDDDHMMMMMMMMMMMQ